MAVCTDAGAQGCTFHYRDATPFDFFIWGYIEDGVFVPSLFTNVAEL